MEMDGDSTVSNNGSSKVGADDSTVVSNSGSNESNNSNDDDEDEEDYDDDEDYEEECEEECEDQSRSDDGSDMESDNITFDADLGHGDVGQLLKEKDNPKKRRKSQRNGKVTKKTAQNNNKRKRRGSSSSFLASSPSKQGKRKVDDSTEQTKAEIKTIFSQNPVEDMIRSASQLVIKLVEYVICHKVRAETFTKKHLFWGQIRDAYMSFAYTIARKLEWHGKETYKEEMALTKDPVAHSSKKTMASRFMSTVTEELHRVERNIIKTSLSGYQQLRLILESLIFELHGIRLQFSIPSLSVLYKSLQSDTWKNVPLMSLQVHEADHLHTQEFKDNISSRTKESLLGAMFQSYLHVRKSHSYIRHTSKDSYVHSVLQAVHKSSMRFFIEDLEKVRVGDNQKEGNTAAFTEPFDALHQILGDLDCASEVVLPNQDLFLSLCHVEGWEGNNTTTSNFNHDPALFFQHVLKHLCYDVVEVRKSSCSSFRETTTMVPIEILQDTSSNEPIEIEGILQKYLEDTSIEVTCNRCNSKKDLKCVHTCNIDQQCFLFLQVQFGENGLPSVSFPENGKIYFKATEKPDALTSASTSADSDNEECYKVEAVIVYKPSEGDNKNMENGCFRTITWDHVYDTGNIQCKPKDALGTILTGGYHEDLGKGYIYILVNENSLKEKPKSSKLLIGCSPRKPIQQDVPPHVSIPSLLEDDMSPITLVDFNHFKFVNKVEQQIPENLQEYSERIEAIVANIKVDSVTISFADSLTKDLALRLRNCQNPEELQEVIRSSLSFKDKEGQECATTEANEVIDKLCTHIMNVNTAYPPLEGYTLNDYKRLVSFPAMPKLLCLQDPKELEWFNVERTDVSKEIYRQRAFSLEELHLLTKIHSIVCMRSDLHDDSGKCLELFHAAAWKNNGEVESHVKECLSSQVENFFQAVRDHGFEDIKDLFARVETLISDSRENNILKIATVQIQENDDATNSNSQTSHDDDVSLDALDDLDDFLPAKKKKVAIDMNKIAKQNVNYNRNT